MTPRELEVFLPEVLDTEARATFQYLSLAPLLKDKADALSSDQVDKGTAYIRRILSDAYRGGNMRVSVTAADGILYGYAIIFGSATTSPQFLHSLFVKPDYRENGLGRLLLKPILESGLGINLLSPIDRVGFFTRSGLKLLDPFSIPDHPAFSLLKGHFSPDVFLLGDKKYPGGAPVFLLNDTDLRTIFCLA